MRAAPATVRRASLPLILLGVSPASIAAQDTSAAPWRCDGAVVSTVIVDREPPTVIGESAPEWARPILRAALQHRTTEASAVRPFLLLKEGVPCTEFRRAESERLLRAQPYLADATVVVIPDRTGGALVHVATVDEIPLVIGGRVRGGRIAGANYGSSNLMGGGVYGAAAWREGFAYRDGLGIRFISYHTFGEPNRFSLSLERAPLSTNVAAALQRPLLTSYQRVTWHAGFSDGSGYASFIRPAGAPLALPVDHSRFDIGGTVRLGDHSRRVFAGPFLTHERVNPGTRAVTIADTGFVTDIGTELRGRFSARRSTRVAAAAGVRLLSFAEARGFDALVGTQDIASGIQIVAIAGRSFSPAADGAVFGVDFYTGAGSSASFVAVRGQWEAERGGDPAAWANAVASARLAWYRKSSERRTLIASGEYAGGWRVDMPYQITLGGEGGLRGYRQSRVVGGRRAVARVDHRWVLGNVTRFMTVGIAAFADVGSVWAGGVPFGENSGLRGSVGAGLLGAVPPQSRRTLRVDLALPLVRDRQGSLELRVSTSTPLRMFWREPGAVSSIRTIVPPVGMFGIP